MHFGLVVPGIDTEGGGGGGGDWGYRKNGGRGGGDLGYGRGRKLM